MIDVTPSRYVRGLMAEWRPWRELRKRSDVRFELVDMPPGGPKGLYACDGTNVVILIDRNLPPAERLATLAHELIHHERGGGCHAPGMPDTWRAVVAREERAVDREVARRLVDQAALARFALAMDEMGHGVSALEVAEEFGVAEHVAAGALELLADDGRLSA